MARKGWRFQIHTARPERQNSPVLIRRYLKSSNQEKHFLATAATVVAVDIAVVVDLAVAVQDGPAAGVTVAVDIAVVVDLYVAVEDGSAVGLTVADDTGGNFLGVEVDPRESAVVSEVAVLPGINMKKTACSVCIFSMFAV